MARLNIALLNAQAEDIVQAEPEQIGQQVEDSLAEATQVQQQITQYQQAMDDAEDVIHEVEEERQVLAQTQAQGGAEPVAMEALKRAAARWEKRLGVKYPTRALALEGFSSKSTRARSTAIAMEGAMEFVKSIIKMITDALNALWSKVKAFFKYITDGWTRLKNRVKNLKTKTKNVEKLPNVKVPPTVLKFARNDNKLVEGDSFADIFIKENAENPTIFINLMSTYHKFFTLSGDLKIATMAKNGDKDRLTSFIINHSAVNELGSDSKQVNGIREESWQTFLGDYVATHSDFYKEPTWEQLSAGYSSIKSTVKLRDDYKEIDVASSEIEGMSKEKINKILEIIEDSASAGEKNNSHISTLEKDLEKITNQFKQLESEKDVDVDVLRVASGYLKAKINSFISYLVEYNRYQLQVNIAAAAYVESCINASKGVKQ